MFSLSMFDLSLTLSLFLLCLFFNMLFLFAFVIIVPVILLSSKTPSCSLIIYFLLDWIASTLLLTIMFLFNLTFSLSTFNKEEPCLVLCYFKLTDNFSFIKSKKVLFLFLLNTDNLCVFLTSLSEFFDNIFL